MKSRNLLLIIGGSLFAALNAMANTVDPVEPPFYITGLTQVQINTSERAFDGTNIGKIISLSAVTPSESFVKRKRELENSAPIAEKDYRAGITPFNKSAGAVDLGMSNVPVLDQGQEGTCVTFATTAAMDVLLGKGDFISQQCTLMLNDALGNNYWDGAYYSSEIIDPLKTYGLVAQNNCNAQYPDRYTSISLDDYSYLVDPTVNANAITYRYTNGISLNTVKAALNKKHRVLIGFGLVATQDPISVQGFNVKIGSKTTTGGLWACKQPSSSRNYCGNPTAGHEVIIIGYDDTQQLLKIRNSWNTQVGDNGNYYMTYTFFNSMNGDGTEIYKVGTFEDSNAVATLKKK